MKNHFVLLVCIALGMFHVHAGMKKHTENTLNGSATLDQDSAPLHPSPSCFDLNDASCWSFPDFSPATTRSHRLVRRWNSEELAPYTIIRELKVPQDSRDVKTRHSIKARGGVALAYDKDHNVVIIKMLKKKNNQGVANKLHYIELFRHEIEMHQLATTMHHPAITKVLDHFEKEYTIAFTQEWMNGGTLLEFLFQRLKEQKNAAALGNSHQKQPLMSEIEMRHVFYQLASALFHIHEVLPPQQQFAHRVCQLLYLYTRFHFFRILNWKMWVSHYMNMLIRCILYARFQM